MTPGDRPTFTVVTPADADARRFIPLDTIRDLSGIPSTVSDDTLGLWEDAVLAMIANSCNLATARGSVATLAQEEVRATWVDSLIDYGWRLYGRGHQLLLPWRVPITEIAVTEAGIELTEDVDYRLLGAGVLERLVGGSACGWGFGPVVVDYTAGWLEDDETNPVPADLVMLVANQVRLTNSQSIVDPILRSEDIAGVWSGTFNTPGGDAIATDGLMLPLYNALNPFRGPPSFA